MSLAQHTTETRKRRALTIAEAAAEIGVSRSTYYRLMEEGAVPRPRLIGTVRRVDALALAKVLEDTFA